MPESTTTACAGCERCQWQPDVDCGVAAHPHCPICGHCMGRHGALEWNDDPLEASVNDW